jgi:uncharacterized protein (PEP-CTERM system associated)
VRRALAVLAAVGVSGSALAQVAPPAPYPPTPYPQVGPIPGAQGPLFPPDTTLQPNVQPAPAAAAVLNYPLFNPYRRPIRTDQLGAWSITPRLELRETFDSNPTGATKGIPQRPDGYTSFLPGINVARQTERNTFVLDYQLEGRKYYENEGLDQIRNNLVEYSNTNLVEELLWLDTRAFIGQTVINQRNATGAVPQLQGNNTTEYYNYSLSPYIRNHLGSFADTELRYTFAQNTSQDSGGTLPNALTNQISAVMNSGTDFSRLLWSVNGIYSDTDRSGLSTALLAPQFSSRNINAAATRGIFEVGAEYGITREFSIIGTGGYESIHDPTLEHNIDDGTWSAGFRLRPGPSTSLLLVYGFREGEHFWSGNANYDYDPNTRFTMRYTEGLVTNDTLMRSNLGVLGVDEFGNFIDPITRQQFDPTYSLFSLTTLSFRQKRFEGSFHAVRQVNYFDVLAYHDDRTAQVTLTSDTTDGVTAAFGRDLNPLTNAFISFRYQHVKFQPDLRVDNNYGFTLGVRYALTETTDTYANYSYLVRDSRPSINNLDDHVFFVGIRRFF